MFGIGTGDVGIIPLRVVVTLLIMLLNNIGISLEGHLRISMLLRMLM